MATPLTNPLLPSSSPDPTFGPIRNSPSERQIEANRHNSQHSTGPRTADGKAAASQNATRYGLFAANLQVRPDEAEAYSVLRDDLLRQFMPEGALEECLFVEITNAQWRLFRCTLAERAIKPLQNEADLDFAPHDFASPAQKAIDRARAAAKLSLRRDTLAFQQLQAERWKRAELFSKPGTHPAELGAVPISEAAAPTLTTLERARIHLRAHNLYRYSENGAEQPEAPLDDADLGHCEVNSDPGRRPFPGTRAA